MTPDERDEYPKRSPKGEQATDANNKIKLTFQIPNKMLLSTSCCTGISEAFQNTASA